MPPLENGGDMMELDFDDTVVLGLHGYVRMVSRALGLRGECSYVQPDRPVSAYLAVDGRLPGHPDRDVALLWDEHRGWSAAVETDSGEELVTVTHLGQDLLPAPETVAAWARDLLHPDRGPGHAVPLDVLPVKVGAGADASTVRQHLTAYLRPVVPTTHSMSRSPSVFTARGTSDSRTAPR
ncbi:DUF6292 family protein [Actinophytocola glycyrrhizae]|uniref:DUF6292 family protein n=1 Tax=Actinophytocola glycyrrhizae TaxID=2044873 RepID=A0ABV9RS01_9PSEU